MNPALLWKKCQQKKPIKIIQQSVIVGVTVRKKRYSWRHCHVIFKYKAPKETSTEVFEPQL